MDIALPGAAVTTKMPRDLTPKNDHADITDNQTILSEPHPDDGADIESLVRSCGALDNNSTYAYLLLCKHFAATCVVARRHGRLAGFISGYLKPGSEDTLFVWQVAVAPEARRQGLGGAMLRHLLQRHQLRQVGFLEATVGPENLASRALFTGFAEELGTRCEVSVEFARELFSQKGAGGTQAEHEDEYLFRIGPFTLTENAYDTESRYVQPHGVERPLLHQGISSGFLPGARRPDVG